MAFDGPPYSLAAMIDSYIHPPFGRSDCFLADVKQLWIHNHSVETFEDTCPALEDLGMPNVTSVHLACGYREAPHRVIAMSLKGLEALKTVILHLGPRLGDETTSRKQIIYKGSRRSNPMQRR